MKFGRLGGLVVSFVRKGNITLMFDPTVWEIGIEWQWKCFFEVRFLCFGIMFGEANCA